jgi:nucleoside-diphosphate-sugar epimerase
VNVLITGAAGFVGARLVSVLQTSHKFSVRAAMRRLPDDRAPTPDKVAIGDIGPGTDWHQALASIDVVVHLAARVHVMRDEASDPLQSFLRTNTEATLQLARQAAQSGVKRLVFLSSVKVNGERTSVGRPFRAGDAAAPEDAYAISKHRAELGLLDIAAATGLEVVIIRPPLVYGPGVKANFAALMNAIARGVPLPLGLVQNQRSLVALDNLVDLIVCCIAHPRAAGQTFLVSDGEDLSTCELVRRLAHAMRRPARLLPVPVWALKVGATVLGKPALAQRLCDNLQVDMAATRDRLDWTPPLSVDEGLRRALGRGDPA